MRVYEMDASDSAGSESENGVEVARFIVLYAKASTRKHKKWEGDGILVCFSKVALLKSEDEKEVICRSTSIKRVDELEDGKVIKMGSLEVQIQEQVECNNAPVSRIPVQTVKKILAPVCAPTFRPLACTGTKRPLQNSSNSPMLPVKKPFTPPVPLCSSSFASSSGFVSPMMNNQQVVKFVINEADVQEHGATPVLCDNLFSGHLREHQKQGIQFMFKRLQMSGGGCILADEMGLGKTIQTMATTWALLSKQCRDANVKKCLLVVPSSLVNNWKAEFKKWFRASRNPVMGVIRASDIDSFKHSFNYNPYMLISYDMALRYIEKLSSIDFDIIVCDEGHRLKNLNSKIREALYGLNIPRRLLLTGTPLQNDIDEFYSLLDFVRPNKFGTVAAFRQQCMTNEFISDMPHVIEDTIIRRTSEVNNAHLPDKHEYVVFCRPSTVQRRVFTAISEHILREPLVLIDYMRKLSNHPAILYKKLAENETKGNSQFSQIMAAFPPNYGNRSAVLSHSGKLIVLLEMLACFRSAEECCVIVSNYTKTLDMISGLCSSIGLNIFRLDGSVPVSDRQKLVNAFNEQRDPANVFLLSTKAGGVGLNLIGASRLILFDSDWNPAPDLQAMARIWRDGQIKTCHIYRMATTGTIDEKMFQRQVKKTGLSSVIDLEQASGGNVKFNDEDLMDIFSLADTECNTHDMMDCQCGGIGLLLCEMEDDNDDEIEEQVIPVEEDEGALTFPVVDENGDSNGPASMAELFRWRHFSPQNESAWIVFRKQAGLSDTECKEISYAFHSSIKY